MADFDGLADVNTDGAFPSAGIPDTAAVVRLEGEVDLATAEHAAERLRAAEAIALVNPPAVVVLDLSRVTFLGSVGLAMMVEHNQLCAAMGGRLCVVVAGNQSAWRPIQLASLDGVLTIVPSVAEALRA
jgi:anti-sigma B factor antagonist